MAHEDARSGNADEKLMELVVERSNVVEAVARNGRRWWKNSGLTINVAFPVSYFDNLGLPRLAAETSTR